MLKKENSQVKEIEVNGEIISESQGIVEYLNSFFIENVKEIAERIPHLPYETVTLLNEMEFLCHVCSCNYKKPIKTSNNINLFDKQKWHTSLPSYLELVDSR